MKTLLAVIAFLLFMAALVVADGGNIFGVAWNVYLCGGLAALAVRIVAEDKL